MIMKTGGNIISDRLSESISIVAHERFVINCWLPILNTYYQLQPNFSFSIQAQQHYIDAIFHTVDFLYQFYDLDPIYFSLLDHAIRTLEKLTSADDQKEMLAEYCDRATIVFQTAADKTEQDLIYKRIWSIKAKEYRSKADTLRGITSDITHEERIMQLYKTFAESVPHEFIRNLLLGNYRRYENSYRVNEPQSDVDGLRRRKHREMQDDDEQAPLLNGLDCW